MDMQDKNISICHITNKENGEDLTVYSEWSDLKLKIVIAKADKVLEGEILKQDFSSYAETFEKSITDYLKETQDILAGKSNDIDFVLKNDKFFWKRKKWSLGQIGVKPLLENSHASSLMLNILNRFSQNIKNLLEVEEKWKSSENTNSQLSNFNMEIIKKKQQSESEWYKKSILIVNSKKRKIRELSQKIEQHVAVKDSIFDADTENSDSEKEITVRNDIKHRQSKKKPKHSLKRDDEELVKKKKCDISVQTETLTLTTDATVSSDRNRQSKREPRYSLDSDDEEIKKQKKCDIAVQTEYLIDESPIKEKEAIASSSKTLPSNIGEDEETPDFLTDESECEVELKFEDDKNHNETEMQENAMTREESSEELF